MGEQQGSLQESTQTRGGAGGIRMRMYRVPLLLRVRGDDARPLVLRH